MKKSVKIFSLCLLLAGSVFAASDADDYKSEKSKSYSKSYTLDGNDKVSLNNSFGEMKITTWSKNEIKVDVTIIGKANSDQNAQSIIDAISIEDGKSGSDVFFKTHIKDGKSGGRNDDDDKDERSSMKINYTVYLPSSATLSASNQFGPMTIGDYEGSVSLTSKFGSLTAGKLSQVKKIEIEFGTITSVIESVTNGKLIIQFSRAQINKLSGDISANFNQSRGIKIGLDNSLKKLDLNNNFGEILLDADKNFSGSFHIQSSFGKFTNESSFSVSKGEDDEDRYVTTNRTYTGKSGSGTTPVTVKNNFGKVILGHDMPFDLNSKTKYKSKDRDDDEKEKDKSEKKRSRA